MSLQQLINLAAAPILLACQRGVIRLQLDASARNVDMLNRQIKNDMAAKVVSPQHAAALDRQIAQHRADIVDEHRKQANLNARLIFLR